MESNIAHSMILDTPLWAKNTTLDQTLNSKKQMVVLGQHQSFKMVMMRGWADADWILI